MVEEFLDELADGVAGLFAQVFGDFGLLKAGLVNEFGQGFDTGGRRERDQQPERVGHFAAAFPVRVNADGNLRVKAGGSGNEETELDAVGKEAETFAGGEQHALGNARVAEPVSQPASGRGVEVGVEVNTPDAQPSGRITIEKQRTAVFIAFACLDGFNRFDAGIAKPGDERFDDMVLDAQTAAVRNEVAEFAADELPVFIERAGFRAGGLGQERKTVELGLEIELHERLRQRRAGERAIGCEVEGHWEKG